MFTVFKHRERARPELQTASIDPLPSSDLAINREVARHLPLLSVLQTQVRETAQQIEEAVVGVCSTFHQIAEQAKSGVARASGFLTGRSLPDGDDASVGQLIEETRGRFDSLLRTLARGVEISQQAVQRMQDIDRHADKIRSALRHLEEIGNGNRILALNARIEAAHAGAYGKGFEAVATEVIAQTDRSRAVIDEVSGTIKALRASAASALADLRRMNEQGLASANEERTGVERTLCGFNAVDQQMRSLLQSASEDSARLSDEINRAVRGMQFQDRVNQRLGHVTDALSESHARLSGVCGPWQGSDAELVQDILSKYTMHEERSAVDHRGDESSAGDVELF